MSESRTSFLESADAPDLNRIQRLERFLFRQRSSTTAVPFAAQSVSDPRVFQPNEEGSGSFGRWMLDEAGLPAYEYQIDQYSDPRAAYPNTEELDRRDHWHQVGNQRITAMASNDGTVQVYLCDRGGVFLNRFEAWEYDRPNFRITSWLYSLLRSIILFITKFLRRPKATLKPLANAPVRSMSVQPQQSLPPRGFAAPEMLAQISNIPLSDQSATRRTVIKRDPATARYAHAGGFGYLDNGSEVWGTAFRYRPQGAHTRRIFGLGYFESETTHQNIRVIRRVYAPYGDDPALIADVQIENLGSSPIDLRHYEYWDVNVQQLQLEWLRSGGFGTTSDANRKTVNKYFTGSLEWDETNCALRFRQQLRQPAPSQSRPPVDPSDIDWEPAHVFLADLSGKPDAFYVSKNAFFGTGGARQPDAVRQRKAGDTVDVLVTGESMPYCLVMRRDLNLQPGGRKSLRYAYGTTRPNGTLGFLNRYRQQTDDHFSQTLTSWKENLAYFSTGEDPVLQREMAWHAYNMLSAVIYLDFYKTHIVPQGSAYLYLHGADGAPRDQALFALPATYIDPALARDMLRLIMQITDVDSGQISYSFAGHGFLSDGLGVYSNPSDLDLFFLLALCEYLSATGDFAFLDQPVPFYPPSQSPPGATVLDHVNKAVHHLFDVNGIGENGLIKVGTNDWSDSIVTETALQDGVLGVASAYFNSKQHGESIPNTQMALYVLPLLAALVKDRDPQLVEYIYDIPSQPGRLERLRLALQDQWNENGWYNRAILRDSQNRRRVVDHCSLEAQVWALISGVASDHGKESTLIGKVDEILDSPSLIGGTLIPDGMVWPAISQLLTWGYAHTNQTQLAWRSLNRNTFAMHSHVYPNIWFNTWSGPDGINGRTAELPGGTWFSPLTPMTDFPVMNANQDAMALLGLLRVCGIEPSLSGDGLVIRPHVPRNSFILDMPLIRLEVTPERIALRYCAIVTGSRTFYIHHSMGNIIVKVNDQAVSAEQQDDLVAVTVQFEKDQVVNIEIVPA
jgi:hypothetical protein